MNHENREVYRSRVDLWLLVTLLGSPVAAALPIWLAVQRGLVGSWVIAVFALFSVALPGWFLLGTGYALEKDALSVTCGPFRWKIAYDEIRSVNPTRNPRSSPALSLERLDIRYGEDRALMVSPADSAGFRRALAARCRQLQG
ncbi:MAG: PH domain-containing protein [Gammaproteobacteria bacterium]